MRRTAFVVLFVAALATSATAAGWKLTGGSSALVPQGHQMFMLTAVSAEGGVAMFSCNTIGPHVSFTLQIGLGGLTLKSDGYGNKYVVGKQAPVSVTWSIDGKVAGKGRWKRHQDFANADDKSVAQLIEALAAAKQQISFKAANATNTFPASGITGLATMLKKCG